MSSLRETGAPAHSRGAQLHGGSPRRAAHRFAFAGGMRTWGASDATCRRRAVCGLNESGRRGAGARAPREGARVEWTIRRIVGGAHRRRERPPPSSSPRLHRRAATRNRRRGAGARRGSGRTRWNRPRVQQNPRAVPERRRETHSVAGHRTRRATCAAMRAAASSCCLAPPAPPPTMARRRKRDAGGRRGAPPCLR